MAARCQLKMWVRRTDFAIRRLLAKKVIEKAWKFASLGRGAALPAD